jgi:hypothetical protein
MLVLNHISWAWQMADMDDIAAGLFTNPNAILLLTRVAMIQRRLSQQHAQDPW